MNTEIADKEGFAGSVYFDAQCGLCSNVVRSLGPTFNRRGFVFCPLQTEAARKQLGLAPGQLPDEMKLVLPTGQIVGGATALLMMARIVWWLWLPAMILELPGFQKPVQALYVRVARNRRCLNRVCKPRYRKHQTATTFWKMS